MAGDNICKIAYNRFCYIKKTRNWLICLTDKGMRNGTYAKLHIHPV